MDNHIKVSVIVPVYNVELYLRKCLDSLRSQTYSNIEVVLVDDGSSDRSGEICNEYMNQDTRFIVIHKQNEGVAKARITAFENSTGELITFVDGDDYISEEYIEKLATPILIDNYDMVVCNYYEIKDNIIIDSQKQLKGAFKEECLSEFIAYHYFYDNNCKGTGMNCFLWSKMMKRDFAEIAIKEGKGLWFGEDQIGVFAVLTSIKSLYLIPDKLYYYIRYKEQTTQKYNLSLWDSTIHMLKKYRELAPNENINEALDYWTWHYINSIIFYKMSKAHLKRKEFIRHLSYIRNNDYIKRYLTPYRKMYDIKSQIKYILLKKRMYHTMFFLVAILSKK